MKVILLLAVSCLYLHQGKGAPTTAVYKFVKCNPEGDQANCVTQQTREMAWNQLLLNKLPASAARFLNAEPVKDESPDWVEEKEQKDWEDEEDEDEEEQFNEKKDDDEKQVEEEEDDLEEDEYTEVTGERGESPVEDGSGADEGFSGEGPQALRADGGSGEQWTEKDLFKVGDLSSLRRFFPGRSLFDEPKPEERELREDHLLQP